MAVERCPQALLVEMVTNEADTPSEDEQAVESSNLDVLVRLLSRERARIPEEIDETDGDASINVQDELDDNISKRRIINVLGNLRYPFWRW